MTKEAIQIRPWADRDLPLLERLLGDSALTEHLGGPETPSQLANRQERYVQLAGSGKGRMFVIVDTATNVAVGSVGYRERQWQDQPIYEIGWSVLIPYQGRGIAGIATAQAIAFARGEGKHRYPCAFPSIANLPSNGICRKLGFTLLSEEEFEYPPGKIMRCNDWRLDLCEELSAIIGRSASAE